MRRKYYKEEHDGILDFEDYRRIVEDY